VIGELIEEAKSRDPKQSREWVVLVDGQDFQIDSIKKELKKNNFEAVIILDIIHVLEYLLRAAHRFFDEGSWECEYWVNKHLEQLLTQGGTKTAGSIRMSAAKVNLAERDFEVIEKSANYLSKRGKYTDYPRYLSKGYPIGTGVIEGACRYLIKDRMEITGARWRLAGAESILKLRSIVKNRDFDAYWIYHMKTKYEENYSSIFFK